MHIHSSTSRTFHDFFRDLFKFSVTLGLAVTYKFLKCLCFRLLLDLKQFKRHKLWCQLESLLSILHCPCFIIGSIGTLSKDGNDGSENIGKKMNLHSFKVIRIFGTTQYVKRILFRFTKRKENSLLYVHVLHKTVNQEVSRCSCAVDVTEMS